MKSLLITLLLLCCHRSLGTLVVNLHESSNEKTFLALGKGIEINNPLTFCLRFNIKDSLATNYIFSSVEDKLGLILRFPESSGFVLINRAIIVFKIPKDNGVLPFHWHHICVSSNEDNYTIVLDGHKWYHANHAQESFENTTVTRLDLGSTNDYWIFEDGINLNGHLSELNIWRQSLSFNQMKKITKNCGKADPIPDLLNWSELPSSMISGSKYIENIENICLDAPVYKIMPGLYNQKNAIHVCKILNGELAFPNSLNELQTWNGKLARQKCIP